MKTKKVFIIISKKQERIKIRRKSKKFIRRGFCKYCGKSVGWLTFEEVMQFTRETSEEIKQKCEPGKFEFQITKDGEIVFCVVSLFGNSKK